MTTFPKLKRNIVVDVVVVGGGMVGISCAFNLSKAGYKTVVLEKKEIGNGTTGMSSGILYYGSGTNFIPAIKLYGSKNAALLWKQTESAIKQLVGIAQKYHIRCELRRCGAIMVAKNAKEINMLKAEHKALRKIGINAKLVTTKQIKKFFLGRKFPKGLAFEICSQLYPKAFALGLAKKFKLKVYENSEVKKWEHKDGKVMVHTAFAKIECSKLILATNYQTKFKLDRDFFMESTVVMKSTQSKEIKKTWPREKLIWTMGHNYDIVYPRGPKAVLELFRFKDVKAKLAYYYKDFDFKVDQKWGGSWSKTKDYLPIFGEVAPNIFVAMCMGD